MCVCEGVSITYLTPPLSRCLQNLRTDPAHWVEFLLVLELCFVGVDTSINPFFGESDLYNLYHLLKEKL